MRRWIAILAVAILAAAAHSPAARADGASLYAANCAKCHGPTGNADTPVAKAMKVASLHDPKIAAAGGPAFVADHIRTDARHAMVSKALSDDDLKAIAAFVQTLASGR